MKEAVLPRLLLTFLPGKQAVPPRQLLSFLPGKEAIHPQQVVSQALSFPLGKEDSSSQAIAHLPSSAKEAILLQQLLTFLPVKEAIHPQQVVRQALSFPLGKEAVLPRQLLTFPPVKEAILPWQLLNFLLVKEAIHPQQVVQSSTLLPSREGSSSSQAIAHLPLGEGSSIFPGHCSPSSWGRKSVSHRQLLTFLPVKEAIHPQHIVSQVLSFPLGKEAVLPRQLLTFPPVKEAILPWQLLNFLLVKEAIHPQQVVQSSTLLPSREGSSFSKAIAHLLSGEGSNSFQATAHLPPGEGNSSPQAGQSSNQARSVRQGLRQYTRHRAPQASQKNSAMSQEDNHTTTTPSRLPQGSSNEEPNPKWVINLSNKPLTPAQRSVLAKGPNFAVTPRQPPNLEYITAKEAVCTKLSQQDAEELRADINRVLRSSHPPNLT